MIPQDIPQWQVNPPPEEPLTKEAATNSLRLYYDQWRALSYAESAAIRLGRWEAVDRLQQHKQQLQPFIEGIYRRVPPEVAEVLHATFRPMVQELMSLEQQNAAAVAEAYRRAQHQSDQCRATERALHQVQGAYAPARTPVWQTYS